LTIIAEILKDSLTFDFQTLFAAFSAPSENRMMFLNAGVTAMASLLFQARQDTLMQRSMPRCPSNHRTSADRRRLPGLFGPLVFEAGNHKSQSVQYSSVRYVWTSN